MAESTAPGEPEGEGQPAPTRKPRISRELELMRERNRARLRLLLIRSSFRYGLPWVAAVIIIAVSPLPLRYIYLSVQSLAGKQTSLSVGLTASLSLYGVASTITAIVALRRARKFQRRVHELERGRP